MGKLRGNRTLTGTWGEIWVDGVLIAELSKITVKVTANREDVQLDMDVDSKMTGICAARSSPSWLTRTPPMGSRSVTASTTAGTTICRWSTTRRAA